MAKLVGDFITPRFHDLQMSVKIHARDVMKFTVKWFWNIESVRGIVVMLRKTTHNCYPVVDKKGRFAGLILRYQLITILKLKLFCR